MRAVYSSKVTTIQIGLFSKLILKIGVFFKNRENKKPHTDFRNYCDLFQG